MSNTENQILTKRFQTTMIGALYEFEKAFGHLWGYNKDENEELTDNEEQFLDTWEEVRNRILNNGNNQLRKAVSELSKINPYAKQYHYRFRNNEKGN